MSMAFHPIGKRMAMWRMMPSICCIWKQETRTVGIGYWVPARWQLSRPTQTEESPPSKICWLSEIVSQTEECKEHRRRMPSFATPAAVLMGLLRQVWLSAASVNMNKCKSEKIYKTGTNQYITRVITRGESRFIKLKETQIVAGD